MNRTIIATIIIIIVAGGLVAIAVSGRSDQSETARDDNQSPEASTAAPGTPAGSTQEAGATKAAIRDFSFQPKTLKIRKGTAVTWTNNDTAKHNVIADGEAVAGGPPADNPLLGKGESYTFTFNTFGTFSYLCRPHPYMKGSVEVTE